MSIFEKKFFHHRNPWAFDLLLWSRNVSLLEVLLLYIGADLLQDEFHCVVKVRDVSHLELGSISQKGDHVAITKESLDGSHFDDVRVHNFGHVLSSDSGCDTNATSSDLVPHPGLSTPRGDGGDDSDYGQNGNGRNDGFGDGRRSLVVDFLWCKGDRGLIFANILGDRSSLALSTLRLGGSTAQHLNGFKSNICWLSFGLRFGRRHENSIGGFLGEQRVESCG
mmetsp:Transcript_25352/g.69866  ORF Transcript_25352/g.69866 Transcript_25352/m.69866 type:complete len:223 (+) Transcript_25352:3365-4033(+)